jgi:hypothetical protein
MVNTDQPQPLLNVDGIDISGIFDPAWAAAHIPRTLLLAAVLAESGLNPHAERWGRQTAAARTAITNDDREWLQAIIDDVWPDISFGYGQRIVLYHWLGDGTQSVDNVLAVRAGVFADPAGDLAHMAKMLAECLDQARSGDLSPVQGDELLGALAVYNGGHLYPPDDPWWQTWAGNIASYRTMLTRLRHA